MLCLIPDYHLRMAQSKRIIAKKFFHFLRLLCFIGTILVVLNFFHVKIERRLFGRRKFCVHGQEILVHTLISFIKVHNYGAGGLYRVDNSLIFTFWRDAFVGHLGTCNLSKVRKFCLTG